MFLRLGGIRNRERQERAVPGERKLHAASAAKRRGRSSNLPLSQGKPETAGCRSVPPCRQACVAPHYQDEERTLPDAGGWRMAFSRRVRSGRYHRNSKEDMPSHGKGSRYSFFPLAAGEPPVADAGKDGAQGVLAHYGSF